MAGSTTKADLAVTSKFGTAAPSCKTGKEEKEILNYQKQLFLDGSEIGIKLNTSQPASKEKSNTSKLVTSQRPSQEDNNSSIKLITNHQASRENSNNSIKLLAGLEEFLESSASATETFLLTYRGRSELDRHYTKPMLPWIIAEIKNQNKIEKVFTLNCNHYQLEIFEIRFPFL